MIIAVSRNLMARQVLDILQDAWMYAWMSEWTD